MDRSVLTTLLSVISMIGRVFITMVSGALGLSVREHRLIPAADQAELMRQKTGGEMDRGMDKSEGCQLLPGCADVHCLPPFELKRIEKQSAQPVKHLLMLSLWTSIRGCR